MADSRLEEMLAAMLDSDEGNERFVYDDKTSLLLKPGSVLKGHPTIGRGRALDVRGISAEESDYLFGNDVRFAILAAQVSFPWFQRLSPVRQAVICGMIHQLGIDGVRGFHDTIKAIEARDFDRAAKEMLQSLWASPAQTPARARRYAEIMRTGEWPQSFVT